MNVTEKFLRAIHPVTRAAEYCGFAKVKPGAEIGIWSKGAGSRLFADHTKAAQHALEQSAGGLTVYVQTMLIGSITGRGRAKTTDAVCMWALWADVDGSHRTDKGVFKPGPANSKEALAALDSLPIKPGVAVASGTIGSIQAWWLLEQPIFDMARAAELCAGWQALIRLEWKKHGWALDSAHDLARVLRVPGTLNHKYDPPRGVKLVRCNPARRPAEGFEALVAQLERPALRRKPGGIRSGDMDELPQWPADQPRSSKLSDEEVIRRARSAGNGVGEKFAALYDGGDTSEQNGDASSADYALVSHLAFWTQNAEQIVRVMQSSALVRDKWTRVDYVPRTITRVFEKQPREVWRPWKHNRPTMTFAECDRVIARVKELLA
jgi:hypothetical protein